MTPTDEPTDEPTGEPVGGGDSCVVDVVSGDDVSDSGTGSGTDGNVGSGTTEPDGPATDPTDPTDPAATEPVCYAYASGSGVPEGAVEKDTRAHGSGALELPRTGLPVGVLSLVGAGMVALGGATIVVARGRVTA